MNKVFTSYFLPALGAGALLLFSLSGSAAENHAPRKPPSFSEMDTNGDQLLTKDELRGPLLDDFDRFDRDSSGSLTEEELPEPPKHH